MDNSNVSQSVTSSNLNELAKALCKAQSQIKGAFKNTENPYFKSKYADLAAVWDACREPLAKNDLAVIQVTRLSQGHGCILETILVHSSGQFVMGQYPVNPIKADPQGLGSAMTYARRYALMAVVGIAAEDDDGNAASRPIQNASKSDKNAPISPSFEKPLPFAEDTDFHEYITDKQRKRLFAISKEVGWEPMTLQNFLYDKYEVSDTAQISWTKYDQIIDAIRKGPNE